MGQLADLLKADVVMGAPTLGLRLKGRSAVCEFLVSAPALQPREKFRHAPIASQPWRFIAWMIAPNRVPDPGLRLTAFSDCRRRYSGAIISRVIPNLVWQTKLSGESRTMHKAVVARFEIAVNDPAVLKRFYAGLFGWRIHAGDTGASTAFVVEPNGAGLEGAINRAEQGGVRFIVVVDDVLENLCYAEELGGRLIEMPHETTIAVRRVTVGSFVDPEGNRVGLSNGFQQLASAREMLAWRPGRRRSCPLSSRQINLRLPVTLSM